MSGRRWVLLIAGLVASSCGQSNPPPSSTSTPASSAAPASSAHDHAGPPATIADWAKGAKIFANLGTFHRKITTSSPEAQQYFDQGMRYLWAFNHDEATRSFAEAAALDSSCAMCYWGVALTVGPNYNLPMLV